MSKPDIEIIVNINSRFSEFSDGVRVVMLINRGIGNSNKGSRRWINKIITIDTPSWLSAVNKLLEMQYYLNDPDIRLYSCLNNRNIDKAIKMFKHKQLDVLPDMKETFYSRINDSFSSCLMKPENRASKYFMLDVDTKIPNEVSDFIRENMIQVLQFYPTKNGWHYICEPFNVKLAEGYQTFTVNKDAMLLVHFMEESND